MNRILLMVLRNITKVPGLWVKLCRYAKDPDAYPEQERWDHIRHILNDGQRLAHIFPIHGKGLGAIDDLLNKRNALQFFF